MTIDIEEEIGFNTSARAEIKQLSDKVDALIDECAKALEELCRDARAKPVVNSIAAAIKALRDDAHADCISSIDRLLTDEMQQDDDLRDQIMDDIEASEQPDADYYYEQARDERMMRQMGCL